MRGDVSHICRVFLLATASGTRKSRKLIGVQLGVFFLGVDLRRGIRQYPSIEQVVTAQRISQAEGEGNAQVRGEIQGWGRRSLA